MIEEVVNNESQKRQKRISSACNENNRVEKRNSMPVKYSPIIPNHIFNNKTS